MIQNNVKFSLEKLELTRPKSLSEFFPEISIFESEINDHAHPYINSGRCYEYYYAISKQLQPESIFEIGNRLGYSGISMLYGSPHAKFIGWDLEMGTYGGVENSKPIAYKNFVKAGFMEQVSLLRCNSQLKWHNDVPSVDLIHIDGDHSYDGTFHDLLICEGKSRYIIIDDYDSDFSVKQAIDDFVLEYHKQSTYVPTFRGLVVIENWAN